MDDKQFRDRLVALVKQLRVRQAAVFETTEAIEALLHSEPSTGDHIKRLFAFWSKAWAEKHRDRYVFVPGRDAAGFKRLLKVFSPDVIELRMQRYLTTREEFYAKDRHPLPLFIASVNSWGSDAAELDIAAAPRGCAHTPPCRDDATHTRLRMRELGVVGGTTSGK